MINIASCIIYYNLFNKIYPGCDHHWDWNNPENEWIFDYIIRYFYSDNVKESPVSRELDVDIHCLLNQYNTDFIQYILFALYKIHYID